VRALVRDAARLARGERSSAEGVEVIIGTAAQVLKLDKQTEHLGFTKKKGNNQLSN